MVPTFIETDREKCSKPRSGDTVPPLRGSENVENPFSINGGATTWLFDPFLPLIRMNYKQ